MLKIRVRSCLSCFTLLVWVDIWMVLGSSYLYRMFLGGSLNKEFLANKVSWSSRSWIVSYVTIRDTLSHFYVLEESLSINGQNLGFLSKLIIEHVHWKKKYFPLSVAEFLVTTDSSFWRKNAKVIRFLIEFEIKLHRFFSNPFWQATPYTRTRALRTF